MRGRSVTEFIQIISQMAKTTFSIVRAAKKQRGQKIYNQWE